MKTFLFILLFVSACDGTVNLDFAQSNRDTRVYSVFDGTLDGNLTAYDVDFYNCNKVDLLVYRALDNLAVLNADSTQVSCTLPIYTKLISYNSDTVVVTQL